MNTRIASFMLVITLLITLTTPVYADDDDTLYGAVQQTWLSPHPANPGADFGNAIAISGDTLVVGARYDSLAASDGRVSYAGAVYVYERDDGAWVQQARLTAKDPHAGDVFGTSVDIDRDTIVVGAPGWDYIDDDDELNESIGAVYVFVREGDEWVQQDRVTAGDWGEDDAFGVAVALDGDRLAVGAEGKDVGLLIDAGKVYTYHRIFSDWYGKHSFTSPSPTLTGSFGSALDMDGSRLVVGASSENEAGAAYLYYRTGGTWEKEAVLDPDDNRDGDAFGKSVAINDDKVVVGAPFADPDLGTGRVTNAGAAYVYHKKGSLWKQEQKLVLEDGAVFDHFGRSVSVNHSFVAVGASGEDHYNVTRTGAAYLFKREHKNWDLQTRIISDLPYEDGDYGAGVALDGDLIGVSEPGTSAKVGKSFVYSIEAGAALPETGFAPGTVSVVPAMEQQRYQAMDASRLQIPALEVDAPIMGVPRLGTSWDVRWLGNGIGYLEGSAYLTHPGNTVLAGHVYLSDGGPGPFIDLHQLKWGDEIIVNLNGYAHVYQVRNVYQTDPTDEDVLKSWDDYDWVTLVTCKDFDERTERYRSRLIVEAVRIK